MAVALRIFAKDVRHLWPAILLLLLVTAFEGFLNAAAPAENASQPAVGGLWVVVCVFLCASAVLEESLPNHEQYWLTRPFRRSELLGAKVLFVLIFAALPQVVAQSIVLTANGASPLRQAGVLAVTAFGFSMAIGLCAAAVAAVCENLMQFVWAALGAGVGFAVLLIVTRSGAPANGYEDWARNAAMAVVALPLVLLALALQYRTRRTNWARGILAAGIVLTAAASAQASWARAFRLEGVLAPRQQDAAGIQMEFEQGRAAPKLRDEFYVGRALRVMLPIRITGVPSGARLVAERITADVDGQAMSSQLQETNGQWWQLLRVPPERTEGLVHVHATAALRLLGNPRSGVVQARGRTKGLPGDAVCSVIPGMIPTSAQALCAWPGRAPAAGLAWIEGRSVRGGGSFESLFTPAGTSFPLSGAIWERAAAAFSVSDSTELQLQTWEAVANFERELDLPQIRLGDYVVKP